MSIAEAGDSIRTVVKGAAKQVPLAVTRQTDFALWAPSAQTAPTLVIGRYADDGGFDVAACQTFALRPTADGLWQISAADCRLAPGVYGYWFQVADQGIPNGGSILITDPMAFAVDRANPAPPPRTNDGRTVGAPASVVRLRDGRLEPSDPIAVDLPEDRPDYRASMPPNNMMVVYELPTRWVKAGQGQVQSAQQVGVGTFQDVLALISAEADSPHFSTMLALADREHLFELGVNALELLPPADSPQSLEWGYGTANYFAADFDLGHREGKVRSEATAALRALVVACHQQRMRFIQDVVMAFEDDHPYLLADPVDFFRGPSNFGGPFWNYHDRQVTTFDPATGGEALIFPPRPYMFTCLDHWVSFFHIDGVRIDDVHDIDDWFFIGDYCARGREQWRALGGSDDRYWSVGEELDLRQGSLLARSGTADASWDETFKRYVRQLCIGIIPDGRDLRSAVNTMIDCRLRGFSDGAQAVNYIGSHDLTNDEFSSRFYSWLDGRGVIFKDRNIRLAFACLLTAVGVPMILAGDEFADEQDLPLTENGTENKQIDPVNFERFNEPWRRDLFTYVARLVKLRTSTPALGRNECRLLHDDTTSGRRIAVWQRGVAPDYVIVVANFSDFGSQGGLAGEYVVPGWPTDVGDRSWFEVSQTDAPRPAPNAGREPLFAWEAKVYVALKPQ